MPEQEFNSTAAKFISSLVKSLQILCNGQVDFNESIELVGHINVRVDHKFKFDYIVDEQVSKEGEDSATTFLSNSYHSCPPARQPRKPAKSDLHQDVLFPDLPHQNIHGKSKQSKSNHDTLSHSHDLCGEDTLASKDDNNSDFSVVAESQNRSSSQANQMVVKLEGDDDSTDCMVLPASPDYEPAGDVSVEGFPSAGPSASFEESHVNQISRARKRRQIDDQGADNGNSSKVQRNWYERSSRVPTASSHLPDRSPALSSPSLHHSGFSNSMSEPHFQCTTCYTSFEHSEALSSHAAICQGLSDFSFNTLECKVCSALIPTYEDFNDHMRTTHRYLSCSQCTILCPSLSALRGHIHREHKPKFVCGVCSKTFHCKINYKGHMNMHAGAKPYACSKCGKSFAYQQSKHAHEKMCYLTSTS